MKVSNEKTNIDALNYLGITAKQGHLLHKLRRRPSFEFEKFQSLDGMFSGRIFKR